MVCIFFLSMFQKKNKELSKNCEQVYPVSIWFYLSDLLGRIIDAIEPSASFIYVNNSRDNDIFCV